MGNNSIKKRSKIEIASHFFIVVGIISAIAFSGYQAYYLRKDFILSKRPYIKIDSQMPVWRQTTFLGIPVNRENYFICFFFHKNKEAGFAMSFELKNVGNSPARIKDVEVIISDPQGKTKFTKSLLEEADGKKLEYIVFPNETLDETFFELFTPETTDFKLEPPEEGENNVQIFNRTFSSVQKWIKEEHFVCKIKVKYTLFTESKDECVFTTYKVWVVEPGGKRARVFYYDID